jgi:hypothetical protein
MHLLWRAVTPCSEVETSSRLKDYVASYKFLPEFTSLYPRRHYHVNIRSCTKQYSSYGRLDSLRDKTRFVSDILFKQSLPSLTLNSTIENNDCWKGQRKLRTFLLRISTDATIWASSCTTVLTYSSDNIVIYVCMLNTCVLQVLLA